MLTFRWRLVGCMYWPSVRQSTLASRNSATSPQQCGQEIVVLCITILEVCLCVQTSQGVEDLLVSLAQSQHDGRLGEHIGFDLFSVLKDTQRLVNVCSGVTHKPANRWKYWAIEIIIKKGKNIPRLPLTILLHTSTVCLPRVYTSAVSCIYTNRNGCDVPPAGQCVYNCPPA